MSLTFVTLVPAVTGAQTATTVGGLQALSETGDGVLAAERPDREIWTIARGITVPELIRVRGVLSAGLRPRERRTYRFEQAARDLRVLLPSGRQTVLAGADVLRNPRRGVADPSRDGAVKGALIGAGAGLGLIAIGYATCGSCDAAERKVLYPVGAAYGAGVGAIVGWMIDKLHKGRKSAFPVV